MASTDVIRLICAVIFILLAAIAVCTKRRYRKKLLKKIVMPALVSIFVFISTFVVLPSVPSDGVADIPDSSNFQVHFIDVGQADCALVICDGQTMLIDGGNAEDSDLVYAYLVKLSIDKLNYVVCTHAHEDHVGGLAGALNYATAETAICPVEDYDSRAFESFIKYLGNTDITIPEPGDVYTLGNANFEILGPVEPSDNANNTSIVLRLTYGDTSFLFAGDAEVSEEEDIIMSGRELESTVLKVGHHGSDTSSSWEFLSAVSPEYAVISVGTGNSYGHPSQSVLDSLTVIGATIYRTDISGTIICESDGENVFFSVEHNSINATLSDIAG